ncbi:TerB family tellurite resistance protein [Flavobacteriaceae bacterium]|nr:TerB family tellurite resistance protein [Flavobacteriaceae bacterium]
MKNFTKWLGAGLGFSFGGPIGAILGFALGNMIDVFSKSDIESFKTNRAYTSGPSQPGDFEISLLILSSIVIKSDGRVDQRELDFVRKYFVEMYGKEKANAAFRLFKEIIKSKKISTAEVCNQIRHHLNHATRLQLIHFLFGIAKSDGLIDENEIRSIHTIANYLYISAIDFDSIKSMFVKQSDSAYTILEIDKDVSDQELKKAYRKMVKKYHPDKLQGMGEDHRKGAEKKFIAVQQAYEQICKERGI